jgi:hypothetical protein
VNTETKNRGEGTPVRNGEWHARVKMEWGQRKGARGEAKKCGKEWWEGREAKKR